MRRLPRQATGCTNSVQDMALSPRLDLRQSQALVMTPQLQQAIKLLQLSNLELLEFVEQELEQNPLLEHDDAEADPAITPDVSPAAPDAAELPPAAADAPLTALDGASSFDAEDHDQWSATSGLRS